MGPRYNNGGFNQYQNSQQYQQNNQGYQQSYSPPLYGQGQMNGQGRNNYAGQNPRNYNNQQRYSQRSQYQNPMQSTSYMPQATSPAYMMQAPATSGVPGASTTLVRRRSTATDTLKREEGSISSHPKMVVNLFISWVIVSLLHGLPGAKGYRSPGEVAKNNIQPEPTCEELKAMWRFSKRQSRAAELTNELPMYPDPFAANVWQPFYATSRSIGGRPVAFGKVSFGPARNKINPEHLIPYFQYGQQMAQPRRRPATSFRLPGGGHMIAGYPPQSGSFNHLKELIKTERARELHQQRLAEESAARAAALKEMGRNQPGRYTTDHFSYDIAEPQEIMYAADMPDIQEEEETMPEEEKSGPRGGGIISFPDLLAPGSRPGPEGQVARFVSDYVPYTRSHGGGRMRSHGPSLFDPSAFRDAYNTGYIL